MTIHHTVVATFEGGHNLVLPHFARRERPHYWLNLCIPRLTPLGAKAYTSGLRLGTRHNFSFQALVDFFNVDGTAPASLRLVLPASSLNEILVDKIEIVGDIVGFTKMWIDEMLEDEKEMYFMHCKSGAVSQASAGS